MKKFIIITTVFILGGVSWIVYKTNENTKESNNKARQDSVSAVSQQPPEKKQEIEPQKEGVNNSQTDSQTYSGRYSISSQEASPFPPPSVEKIGSVTQRTIHVGVRQWEWVPAKITANYGEKVILILHNADVTHSIFIPDLNVKQDIPNDGAVVQFMAAKRGTFTFFCDTPCGKGHGQMKGEIAVT